jgi:hypothetical protein
MKTISLGLSFLAIHLFTHVMNVSASGPVGIYAAISKVEFEPSEAAAERVKIWGAFSLVEGGINVGLSASAPRRGYLYFSMPAGSSTAQREVIRKEWADFKSVAGRGQVVAFGDWASTGGRLLTTAGGPDLRVLDESDVLSFPSPYSVNTGVVKVAASVNNARIVEQLKAILKD